MNLSPDLIDLLAEFAAESVEYLLIGGHAVAVHGRPRFTKNFDLWLGDTPENLQRAIRALTRFGAPQDVLAALPLAAPEDVVWMGHPPHRIDLVKGVPGGTFDDAYAGRTRICAGAVLIDVIGREDLIRIKVASGRPHDLEDARALRKAAESDDPS